MLLLLLLLLTCAVFDDVNGVQGRATAPVRTPQPRMCKPMTSNGAQAAAITPQGTSLVQVSTIFARSCRQTGRTMPKSMGASGCAATLKSALDSLTTRHKPLATKQNAASVQEARHQNHRALRAHHAPQDVTRSQQRCGATRVKRQPSSCQALL